MKHLKRQKNNGRNIALIVAGVVMALFVLAVFTPSVLGLTLYRDDPKVNDSGLRLPKVTVARNDNAFFVLDDLEEGAEAIKSMPAAAMVSGSTWDAKLARRIISANRKTLRILSTAAQRKYYQNPDIADPDRISVMNEPANLSGYRQAASVSNIRAYHLARAGKYSKALDQAILPILLGDLVQNSQSDLGEYLIAGAMKGMAVRAVEDMLPAIDLPPADLKSYAAQLDHAYQKRAGMAAALKSTYYAGRESVASMSSAKDQPSTRTSWSELFYMSWGRDKFYVQPNKTLNKKAAFYRLLIAESTRPCYKAANPSAFDKFQPKVDPMALMALDPAIITMPNAYGETMLAIALPNPYAFGKHSCENDMITAATQTLLGLKAFKETTGTLPNKLSDLVPLFIDRLPADPYSGNSLLYSPKKKIIYSVGRDGKDSGGVKDPATALPARGLDPKLDRMPDPSFKIKF